jgi:hypothetical protein
MKVVSLLSLLAVVYAGGSSGDVAVIDSAVTVAVIDSAVNSVIRLTS